MSHEINENKRMFYYGEVPWHGLGVKLDRPATSAEAIQAAGLDYKVELHPLYHVDPHTFKQQIVKFGRCVQRTDTKKFLGIVGNDYKIVQNIEAFEFFDGLVGGGKAIYHTAGALGDGERVWILAKLPGDIHITDRDNVEKFLLLMNTHNGKGSLVMCYTPVRVVCQNTLKIAMSNMSNVVKIRHTGNLFDKTQKAQAILGIVDDFYSDFETVSKCCVDRQLTKQELNDYFSLVLNANVNINVSTPIGKERLQKMEELFETGKGNNLPKVRGSLWAALNAVTEYVDHYNDVKHGDRLNNIWFGTGAVLKDRAYNAAVSLIK